MSKEQKSVYRHNSRLFRCIHLIYTRLATLAYQADAMVCISTQNDKPEYRQDIEVFRKCMLYAQHTTMWYESYRTNSTSMVRNPFLQRFQNGTAGPTWFKASLV